MILIKLKSILSKDSLLDKWLRYGYQRLTGVESNTDAIIEILHNYSYSDDMILSLARHGHNLADNRVSIFV